MPNKLNKNGENTSNSLFKTVKKYWNNSYEHI